MKSAARIISIFVLVFCFCTTTYASSTAKLTAKIVDENGASVPGASVCLSFSGAKQGDGGGLTSFCREGLSDKDGLFSDSSGTLAEVGVVADKDGYYRSIQKYEFKSSSFLLNRWEPWNPTVEVVLKKKRNPVAMYIKGTDNLKIPQEDKPIGYDLMVGDMVAPYGAGIVSDFVFTFHANNRAYTDYDCNFTLTFSNPMDGIQEYTFSPKEQSLYRWPFEAPDTGYANTVHKEKMMVPGKGYTSNEKRDIHYLFRIRTKVDKDGKIIEGLYGKIEKEFEFDPTGNIFFGYFLNPDTTRNLEEDPKKNLFKKK